MPQPVRYVVLRHEGLGQPHFDLMFEMAPGTALATWRSAKWPIENPQSVDRLADHRREYLNYEGPISNDRGHVRRVASGTCTFQQQAPADIAVHFIEPRADGLVFSKRGNNWQVTPVKPGA